MQPLWLRPALQCYGQASTCVSQRQSIHTHIPLVAWTVSFFSFIKIIQCVKHFSMRSLIIVLETPHAYMLLISTAIWTASAMVLVIHCGLALILCSYKQEMSFVFVINALLIKSLMHTVWFLPQFCCLRLISRIVKYLFCRRAKLAVLDILVWHSHWRPINCLCNYS